MQLCGWDDNQGWPAVGWCLCLVPGASLLCRLHVVSGEYRWSCRISSCFVALIMHAALPYEPLLPSVPPPQPPTPATPLPRNPHFCEKLKQQKWKAWERKERKTCQRLIANTAWTLTVVWPPTPVHFIVRLLLMDFGVWTPSPGCTLLPSCIAHVFLDVL